MRNLEKEKKWAKEKYGRLDAKLDKKIVEQFKKHLKDQNTSYAKWLENQIKKEINK